MYALGVIYLRDLSAYFPLLHDASSEATFLDAPMNVTLLL